MWAGKLCPWGQCSMLGVFMGVEATDEYVVKIDPEHMQGVQNYVAMASSFQPAPSPH